MLASILRRALLGRGLLKKRMPTLQVSVKTRSWAGAAPLNGSRLSCGRDGRWRKELERQTKRQAGEATQLLPTGERPAASSAG